MKFNLLVLALRMAWCFAHHDNGLNKIRIHSKQSKKKNQGTFTFFGDRERYVRDARIE